MSFTSNKFYPPNSSTPIKRIVRSGAPGNHYLNFIPGDEWFDSSTNIWWKYLYFDSVSLGVWGQLATPGSDLDSLTGDSGGAVFSVSNNINIQGGASGAISFSNGGIGQLDAQVQVDGTTIDIVAGQLKVVGGGFSWNVITVGGPTQMVNNEGYIANAGVLCQILLPATSSVGDSIQIVGIGSGGFRITQNAGQNIMYLGNLSTAGVGGSFSSTVNTCTIEIICTTADTLWSVVDSNGVFTIV